MLKNEIEKSYRTWNEYCDEATTAGWADIFAGVASAEAIEIWQKLSTKRLPNPLEVKAAIAGVDPHHDWRQIIAVASGKLATATISIASAAALAEIGGIGQLRNADSREAEVLRRRYWQGLDPSLGADLAEIALAEYQGGLPAAPSYPALPPGVGSAEMNFEQALEAIKGWEERVYPTSMGQMAQKATALARVLIAGKTTPQIAAMQMKSWPEEAKAHVWEASGLYAPTPAIRPKTTSLGKISDIPATISG
jgi:hypothetical protein